MAMQLKSVSLDGMNNDIITPTEVDSSIKSLTKKVRASVEEETGDTYSEFTPLLYLLVDGYYIVKVAVGGNSCVHIKFKMQGRTPQLDDFEEGKNKADKLQKF